MDRSDSREPGRVVVPSRRVRDSGARVTVPVPGLEAQQSGGGGQGAGGETTPPTPAAGPAEPVVELVRDGDVVRAIDITCPCGRRIRVLCEY